MADPRKIPQPKPGPSDRGRDAARDTTRAPKRSGRDRGRAQSRRRDMSDVRTLNPGEREIVMQVGCYRTIAIEDFRKHLPKSLCASPVHAVRVLKELGLIRSHYIQPHAVREVKKRDAGPVSDTRIKATTKSPSHEVIVLTHKGADWLRANGYDEITAGKLHPGFAKPREAFHDAHLYTMAQRASDHLRSSGATNIIATQDSALKAALYRERARVFADGRTQEQAHVEAAETYNIPLQDGRYALPDVRLEYDAPDGSHHSIDLELITDTYRDSHIAAKAAAGFTSYVMDKAGNVSSGGGSPWDEDWMARSMGR